MHHGRNRATRVKHSAIRFIHRAGLAALLATPLVAFSASRPATAADLTIGLKVPQHAVDPHFMISPTVTQVMFNVFETLVFRDADNKVIPWLAESWERVDDTHWLFHLRRGVKFSDGTPFTSADVVFSFGRAGHVPNGIAGFGAYVNQIERVEAVDDNTVRFVTREPVPMLLYNLTYIMLVSKKHGEAATTEDYSAGRAMVGTGPYKFVSWALNDKTSLTRNPDYWGKMPAFDNLTYRMIPNDATRIAALQSGQVDIIENIPSQEVARLKNDSTLAIWTMETPITTYIAMDPSEAALASGKLTGPNGEKLIKNPFADSRVREALRMAIDVDSIVARLFGGLAVPNNQFLASRSPGFNKTIAPYKFDAVRAKQLLDEAGWGGGKFKIDVATSPDTFQNAVATTEVIAQAWTRIGVPTTVSQFPSNLFQKVRSDRAVPIYATAFQNQSGTAEILNSILLHTRQPDKGWGLFNLAFYSNPEVDKLVEQAAGTMDDEKRWALLREVAVLVDRDKLLMPMFLISESTGTKKSINYGLRFDRLILPANVN